MKGRQDLQKLRDKYKKTLENKEVKKGPGFHKEHDTPPEHKLNKLQKKKLTKKQQIKKIKKVDAAVRDYLTLKKAAQLSGIHYRTAMQYSKLDDPRIDSCKRYPRQTGARFIMYTTNIVKVFQTIKKENLKKRGTKGKRWEWSEKSKKKRREKHKRGDYSQAQKKRKTHYDVRRLKKKIAFGKKELEDA